MKKLVRMLFCSLPLIMVTACGGGGGSSSTAADPSTPPSVISVIPLDGTVGVSATSTVIKVAFTNAMDPTSVIASPKAGPIPDTAITAGTFRVSYLTPTYTFKNAFNNISTVYSQRFVIDGTLTADATNTVFTFTPKTPLTALDGVLNLPLNSLGDSADAARNFIITIKGGPNGVKKADGTPMALDFNASFTIWAGTQQTPSSTVYNDVANGVGTDASGNVYLAGYSYGSQFLDTTITKTPNTSGILLAKYDPDGVWQWNALLGSQFNDQINGFTIDNTSISGTAQLVSVGGTYGTLNYLVNSNLANPNPGLAPPLGTGTQNYFVAKFIEGNSQPWTVSQSGTSVSCVANAVATDRNGNIYVAGETYGNLPSPVETTGTTTTYQGNGSNTNIFVAKYDTKLNLVWTKVVGSGGNDSATGIAVDTNSSDLNHPNVYITGWTDGNLFTTNLGGKDAFVAKFDNNGNLLKGSSNFAPVQFGSAGDDHANAIAVDARGFVTVVGGTSGSLYATNQGGSDIFVVSFDNLGNVLFKRQIGTTGDDEAFGVTTDGLNDVYVTGSTSSVPLGPTSGNLFGINQGGADIFAVKLDNHTQGSIGATVWGNQLGSSQTDVGTSVAYFTGPNGTRQNPTGYLFVAGYTYGDLDTNFNLSGGGNVYGGGTGLYNTSDVFLTKFSSTTGLKY
jgi:hypothetical protein